MYIIARFKTHKDFNAAGTGLVWVHEQNLEKRRAQIPDDNWAVNSNIDKGAPYVFRGDRLVLVFKIQDSMKLPQVPAASVAVGGASLAESLAKVELLPKVKDIAL